MTSAVPRAEGGDRGGEGILVMRVIHLVDKKATGDAHRRDRRRFELANDQPAATGEPGAHDFVTRRPIVDFRARTMHDATAGGRTSR